MVRLFRDQAIRLTHLMREIARQHPDQKVSDLVDIRDDLPDRPLTEEVQELEAAVNADPALRGDLIDKLCHYLAMPFCLNRLHGGNLRRLRSGILDPAEWAKIEASEERMYCAGCKRVLRNNEMVTFYRVDRVPGMYCRKCLSPQVMACSKCQEHAILVTAKTAYRGGVCDHCQNAPAADGIVAEDMERLERDLEAVRAAARPAPVFDEMVEVNPERAPAIPPANPFRRRR